MPAGAASFAVLLAAVSVAAARPVDDEPVSLEDSPKPLVDHFNEGAGKPRFVALVSPTCPACVFGARAVRQSVLDAYPDAGIQVSIVWIDMLASDNAAAAKRSSAIFDDPRVKQFHDPQRRAGRAIAEGLLNEGAGPAWDVYLFYDGDAVWAEAPPEPLDWVHQLGGARRADPQRFRPGAQLPAALAEATGRLLGGVPAAAPQAQDPDQAATLRFEGVILRVDGMTCHRCADRVRDALAGVPGVAGARVDLDGGLAWVTLEAPRAAVTNDLMKAVEQAGFRASVPAPDEVLAVPVDLDVQLLTLPGCPNAAPMRSNLTEALRSLGLSCAVREIDLGALPDDDWRRCFGSPTILVAGRDLMGLPRSDARGLSCRVYPGGVPGADEIRSRLARCNGDGAR